MIAYKCPQYRVTVVDINKRRIEQWNSDSLPVYEPGLDEIVKATGAKTSFSRPTSPKGIRENDIIFVCVNTPTKTFGAGAGMAADLQFWEKTARQILEHARSPKIVVEKSTFPVKTALAMERILMSRNDGIHFDVLSNPEFLAEGTAVRDLEYPDRVLIGSRDTERESEGPGCPGGDLRQLGPARTDHHVEYLEQRAVEARREFLSRPADLDHQCHLGHLRKDGGRCFGSSGDRGDGQPDRREVPYAQHRIRRVVLQEGHPESRLSLPARGAAGGGGLPGRGRPDQRVPERTLCMNMLEAMFNTLAGKRICLFGFAFKANTSDTRESPAIHVVRACWRRRPKSS